MDDRFFNAFLPPTVRVCGRRLTRFTVWHHFILSAIDSPVVAETELFRPADLLLALRACRSTYGRRVSFRPSLADAAWAWRMRRNPALFSREARRFFEWVATQSSPPVLWRENHGGDSVRKVVDSGPQCLALVCSLMSRGGLSKAEAWNMPIGEARWTDAQLAQVEGVPVHFLDDADLDGSRDDLSGLTDEQALEKFRAELPNERLAQQVFDDWRKNIKRKDARHA